MPEINVGRTGGLSCDSRVAVGYTLGWWSGGGRVAVGQRSGGGRAMNAY